MLKIWVKQNKNEKPKPNQHIWIRFFVFRYLLFQKYRSDYLEKIK